MKKLSVYLAGALLCAAICPACGPCKNIPTVIVRDSTVVNYVDSTVYSIKDSTVLVPVPAESSSSVLPNGYSSHVETSIAESDAWIDDGLLHHTIRNKSDVQLPAIVPVVTTARVIRDSSDHNGLTQHTVVKEVEKKLNGWQRLRIGAFFWLIAIAAIGWRRELAALIKKLLV